MPRRIYVASSWRNPHQPAIVAALRSAGHAVYDFRNPAPDNHGFHWSEVDPEWQAWSASTYREALQHPISQAGFASDYGAMQWADTGVLVMPCGRSAHIEAGYFNGAGKDLFILLAEQQEPELMYLMATRLCLDLDELIAALAGSTATRSWFPEVRERALGPRAQVPRDCQATARPCSMPAAAVLTFESASGMGWTEALCQSCQEPRTQQVVRDGGRIVGAEVLARAPAAEGVR